MKEKSIQISIPDPCQQPWEGMPTVNNGRYCSQCSRTIIDFTHLSDAELIALFTKKGKDLPCGVFTKSQLERTYILNTGIPKKSYTPSRLLLAGLLSLRLSSEAQTPAHSPPEIHNTGLKKKAEAQRRVIKGKVTDRPSRQGIYASIRLYTSRSAAEPYTTIHTDSTGHYELVLPESELNKFFKLAYTSERHQARTVVVDLDKIPVYLPVSLAPGAVTQIALEQPKQENVEPPLKDLTVRQLDVVRIMGIPQRNDEITIRYRPYLWYRLKRLFRRK